MENDNSNSGAPPPISVSFHDKNQLLFYNCPPYAFIALFLTLFNEGVNWCKSFIMKNIGV